jgi:hypothetical protein
LWGRYTELNPNSKIGDNVVSQSTDIVVRRLRVQAMGMLTDKVFIQFGQNNINFTQKSGPSNAIIYLDAIGIPFNDQFHLGGLTAWGAGTTRYSANILLLNLHLMLLFINKTSIFLVLAIEI